MFTAGAPLVALREPPSSVQAEQALLGALLHNNKSLALCPDLKAEHFSHPIHTEVFTEIQAMIGHGHMVDGVTLHAFFEAKGRLAQIGGPAYIADLYASMISTSLVKDYARVITDTWTRRQMIDIGAEIVDRAFGANGDTDVDAALTESVSALVALRPEGRSSRFGDAGDRLVAQAEATSRGDVGSALLDTGLHSVDRLVNGLAPGELYYIGARSGTGKTQFLMGMARHNARRLEAAGDKGRILFFSLEMEATALAAISIAAESNWSADQIRNGQIGESEDWLRFHTKAREIQALQIDVDDRRVNLDQLAVRARMAASQGNVRMIGIDFMELVERGRRYARMEETEWMRFLSYQLKGLAKDLRVPIVVLRQLNQPRDRSANAKPTLESIPYDGGRAADAVFAIWREVLDMPDDPPGIGLIRDADKAFDARNNWRLKREALTNTALFIGLKRRFGPPDVATLIFNGPRMRFEERRQESMFEGELGNV